MSASAGSQIPQQVQPYRDAAAPGRHGGTVREALTIENEEICRFVEAWHTYAPVGK